VKIAQCIQCRAQNVSGATYDCLFIKKKFSLFELSTQDRIHKNSEDNAFSIYGPYTKTLNFRLFSQLLVFIVFSTRNC